VPGQSYGKSGAAPNIGLNCNAPVVAFKNAVTDGQAQADTAACFFGGKKGLKDAREDFGGNA
jgi:hypothetical protein